MGLRDPAWWLEKLYNDGIPIRGGGGGGTPSDPEEIDISRYGGTATTLGQKLNDASAPVTLATEQAAELEAVHNALGDPSDAAITTGAVGTISGKLRGLMTVLADVWSDALNALGVNLLAVGGTVITLGQKAMAASFPVTIASDQTAVPTKDAGGNFTAVASGELQGSATALQMPSIACKMVKFKALGSNVGNVYVGAAAVTVPDGTTDTTSGLELRPGEETGWLPVTNLNLFYRICNNAGDDLTYLVLS